jgi:hypothetical protein
MKSLNIIDECVSKVVNMSEIQLLFVQELFSSFGIHFNCAISNTQLEIGNDAGQIRVGFTEKRVTVDVLVEDEQNRFRIQRFRIEDPL